jgi:hypothetical protein
MDLIEWQSLCALVVKVDVFLSTSLLPLMWIHATIPNSGINVFRYLPEAGGFTSHLVIYSLYGAFAWETTHRRQGHMMLSPMGKCPIKCKDLFDLRVGIIIKILNDLTS